MYFNGLFNLDEWDETASYIILDDFDIKFFPQWKSFLGSQREFTATDKYRHKQRLTFGRACIWIANEDPRQSLLPNSITWFNSNVLTVYVKEKLY